MSDFIMLKNVRCSFPHLFTKPKINGEEGKCGATLMLDPKEHKASISQIQKAILETLKERNKGKKIPSDKLCLRDGEDRGRDEYEGYMTLSANSKDKPMVINGSGKGVISDEEECPIYAGCRVNAKVRLWFQDNKFGKRVNCELVAIQFAADDDALDSTHVSADTAMEGFEGMEAANDDDANLDDLFDEDVA